MLNTPKMAPKARAARISLAALLPLLGAVACAGGNSASHTSRSSLIAEQSPAPVYRSPAQWRYHPSQPGALLARLELPGGRVLLAGDRGERWLTDPKTSKAEAASRLAPESLVAILPMRSGFLFVGASGSGYEANEPLGPFVRSTTPLDPLVRLSAAATTIVGVRRDGRLAHSTDAGQTWQLVGPRGVMFADVALGASGRGLALGVPEQLWETNDAGRSWKRIDVAPFGAFGLDHDARAGIVVKSVFGVRSAEGSPPFSTLDTEIVRPRHALGAEPPRGPDAGALAEGRAVIAAGRYYELALARRSSTQWRLVSGPLDGTLADRSFDEANGCQAVRLTAYERYMYFACWRSRPSSGSEPQPIEIRRSEDAGRRWEREPYEPRAKLSDLVLAAGANGMLIVSGICPLSDRSDLGDLSELAHCVPSGVHYRRLATPKKGAQNGQKSRELGQAMPSDAEASRRAPRYELQLAATPSLKGVASPLGVSVDGRIAYAIGRRAKGDALAVFVSHDGGRTFSARDIDQIARPQSDADDDDDIPRFARQETGGSSVQALTAAEDGTLAIVRRSNPASMIVTDEEGRVLSISNAPTEGALLGAAGSRAIALSVSTRDVWESIDAGASWQPIGRLPLPLCPRDAGCDVPICCHVEGCVIGSELSRIGWRGQADDDPGVLPPPDRSTGEIADRKVRTPIACTLDTAGWQRLSGVRAVPSAAQAAIGKVAWYVPSVDEDRAGFALYSATRGAKSKLERTPLFEPLTRPEAHAFTWNPQHPQIEGVAALRYAIPEVTPGESHLKNVEVAWANLIEDRVGHARIADAGVYLPGDYTRGGRRVQQANPELLSIAEGGIYLKVHAKNRTSQDTFYLDGRNMTTLPAIDWSRGLRGAVDSPDMSHIGTAHVGLAFAEARSTLIRARRQGSGWTFDAIAIGLADPQMFDAIELGGLAYRGTHAGVAMMFFDPEGSRRSAVFYPLRGEGAAVETGIPVPTQLDAGDRPQRCGPDERAATPRVLVPFQAGTRHPVLISDSVEPPRVLITGQAVMFGTPDEPCVAAFDAETVEFDTSAAGRVPVPDVAAEKTRAILPLDDLEHAALFRNVRDSSREAGIEWHGMSCRFDASLEVPPEVYGAEGTRVRRGR